MTGAGEMALVAGTDDGEQEMAMALLWHIGHAKKRKLLELYSRVGDISLAAQGAGVHRNAHYQWLASDPEYKAAFEGPAKEILADRMEAEMYRRAVKGIDKNVYYQGRKVDVIKEYSDILLIFGLKGARPEKYNERVVQEHVGTVHVQHSYAVALPAGLDVIDVEAEEVKT